jgi:hypothetical protein
MFFGWARVATRKASGLGAILFGWAHAGTHTRTHACMRARTHPFHSV